MDVREALYDGSSKFMWDGAVYATADAADARRKEYGDAGFEVRITRQEDKYLVYSRRVVTEVVVEGSAPP